LHRIRRQSPVELFDRLAVLRVQKYRYQAERIGNRGLASLGSAGGGIVDNEISGDNIRIGEDDTLLVCPVEKDAGIGRNAQQSGRRSALIPKARQVNLSQRFWRLRLQLKGTESQSQQNKMTSRQGIPPPTETIRAIVSSISQNR